jgi:DNA replication protein DnaC
MDGRLLARAKAALSNRRDRAEGELTRRRRTAFAKNPRLRELDGEIRATMLELVAFALRAENIPGGVDELRRRNISLLSELYRELISSGFPGGYLDETPVCEACSDRGYVDGEMCSCLMELYKEEQRKSLSSLLKLGDETFDNFDLSFYDDAPNSRTGVSPRRNMEIVYETCVQYAVRFGARSFNLFLCGAPGLGKTFLSACIARVVSDSGFSVVYDTVTSILSKFETEKFSRGEPSDDAKDETRRYRECDLLIVDDLGTEMSTSFTISALYELINTRLITGKKTIISSNLTLDELRGRYTPQIMSRIEGEYQVLMFFGADIRILKRNRASNGGKA